MTEATAKFVREGAPFGVVHRFPTVALSGWAVRDCVGEHAALCDSEDAAFAIADALNHLAHKERSKNNEQCSG